VKLSLTPHCDIPDTIVQRTTEECGRSAARRRVDTWIRGGWRPRKAGLRRNNDRREKAAKIAAFSMHSRSSFRFGRLTISEAEDYIAPLGRAAA
jgi:hypothetical protein